MATISTGAALSTFDAERWYAYSSLIQGDVTLPATVDLIDIPSTGLQNSFVKIMPFYGKAVSTVNGDQLGIIIEIDDIEIMRSQPAESMEAEKNQTWEFFIPRSSSLKIKSLNTANNNTQDRGVNILGWYL